MRGCGKGGAVRRNRAGLPNSGPGPLGSSPFPRLPLALTPSPAVERGEPPNRGWALAPDPYPARRERGADRWGEGLLPPLHTVERGTGGEGEAVAPGTGVGGVFTPREPSAILCAGRARRRPAGVLPDGVEVR